jgi:hypothetical protein
MFHTICAKVLIAVMDYKLSIEEAIEWRLRKMPTSLRNSMKRAIKLEVGTIMYNNQLPPPPEVIYI